MSTQVQRRKGTTAQHASFTGASAELTVDTTKNTVVVHDGATAGGIPLAKETGSALSVTSLTSSGAAVIETTDNTNAALRITQLGTGNALLIEDSASPDSSPVVVTNNGTLVVGNTARVSSTSLIEAHSSANVSGTPAIANYSWGIPVGGGGFNLYKSRSGTVGTQALVASGTQSSVRFYFDDGVTFQQAASITGVAEGTPALNSMPGRLAFNTSADGSATPTERMRIDSLGNVGIGTASPSSRLHVQAATPVFTIQDTTSAAGGVGGTINFIGYTSGVAGANVEAQIKGVKSSANAAGELQFYTSDSAGTSQQRAMIDGVGNLGLGVTPSGWGSNYKVLQGQAGGYALSNDGTQNNQMRLSSNAYNNGTNWIYYGTSLATSYEQRVGEHRWYNAPSGTAGSAITFTQAMTLDSSGNLLVGTTTTAYSNTNAIALSAAQGYVLQNHISGTASGAAYTYFAYNATQIGSITQSGTTAVLYNVTSDQRLKENIVDAPEFGSVIDSIKVRSYNWKTDQTHQRAGFIAQELVTVAPEAVHQPENPEEMMAVDYSKLVPMLVKELQSLRARVAQLESN